MSRLPVIPLVCAMAMVVLVACTRPTSDSIGSDGSPSSNGLPVATSDDTGASSDISVAATTTPPASEVATATTAEGVTATPPASSAATPLTTTNSSPAPAPADPGACLRNLPLAWRAGQVLMPAVTGDALSHVRDLIDRTDVGSVILMTWPEGADADALDRLKLVNGVPLLVATDEEGGDVQRLRRLGRIPSATEMASTYTPDDAYALIAEHAAIVAELGIDIVFAPVVDVAPTDGGGPIGDRTFSSDPLVVAEYARAYVDGWSSAGILPVLKHFPGHGRASADSHDGRSTTASLDVLESVDLVPYRALSDLGAGVMVGHLDVPGLTDGVLPASLSPQAIGYLRQNVGYSSALVFTDALNMDAVGDSWSNAEAGVLALVAGADVLVYADTSATDAMIEEIIAAVQASTLDEARLDAAVGRVLSHKQVDPCSLDELLSADAAAT